MQTIPSAHFNQIRTIIEGPAKKLGLSIKDLFRFVSKEIKSNENTKQCNMLSLQTYINYLELLTSICNLSGTTIKAREVIETLKERIDDSRKDEDEELEKQKVVIQLRVGADDFLTTLMKKIGLSPSMIEYYRYVYADHPSFQTGKLFSSKKEFEERPIRIKLDRQSFESAVFKSHLGFLVKNKNILEKNVDGYTLFKIDPPGNIYYACETDGFTLIIKDIKNNW